MSNKGRRFRSKKQPCISRPPPSASRSTFPHLISRSPSLPICLQGHLEGPGPAHQVGKAPPALGEGPGSSLTPPLLLPAQGQLSLPGPGDGATGQCGIPMVGRRAGEGLYLLPGTGKRLFVRAKGKQDHCQARPGVLLVLPCFEKTEPRHQAATREPPPAYRCQIQQVW